MLPFAIKSAIVLAALYIPFTLMLRTETFARFNRCLLLSIIMLSLTLPMINIPFLAINIAPKATIEFGPLTMEIEGEEQGAKAPLDLTQLSTVLREALAPSKNYQLSTVNYYALISLVYVLGMVLTLAVRTIQIMMLRRRITRGCLWTQTEEDGTTIYCHADRIAPFSWFNQIVVSQHDLDDCGEIIMTHERAHAALHHSADMILAMTTQALQWFNPFVWLLTDTLQEIHEYEADRMVLASGTDIRQYQLLLIKKTVGRAWPAFTNSLKSNQLKKRFKMMLQKPSSPWRRVRALYVLPVTLVALSVFATNNNTTTTPQPSPQGEGAENIVLATGNDSVAVETVEAHVLVMENARIDVENNVVTFTEAHIETPATSPTRIAKTHTDDYLIIVDGVPQENAKLEDFNKDDIDNICVIKDEDAKKPFVEKYGAKAKAAVVLITMKDDRVFDLCEEIPEFPGENEAMFKFLSDNLRYPKDAMEQGLQGTVLMSFIVEKTGVVSEIKAVKLPGSDWKAKEYEIEGVTVTGYGKNPDGSIVTEQQKEAIIASLGDEAVRVIKLMPKWNPGKQRGKYVRVKLNLPIHFRLN